MITFEFSVTFEVNLEFWLCDSWIWAKVHLLWLTTYHILGQSCGTTTWIECELRTWTGLNGTLNQFVCVAYTHTHPHAHTGAHTQCAHAVCSCSVLLTLLILGCFLEANSCFSHQRLCESCETDVQQKREAQHRWKKNNPSFGFVFRLKWSRTCPPFPLPPHSEDTIIWKPQQHFSCFPAKITVRFSKWWQDINKINRIL